MAAVYFQKITSYKIVPMQHKWHTKSAHHAHWPWAWTNRHDTM